MEVKKAEQTDNHSCFQICFLLTLQSSRMSSNFILNTSLAMEEQSEGPIEEDACPEEEGKKFKLCDDPD